jgi:hypothetical protein
MEINPKDIRIGHFYMGPGKGSAMKATHLPTGIWVGEDIPTNSTESGSVITSRLLSELKLKIEKRKNEKP